MAMPIGMSDLRGIPPDKRLNLTYRYADPQQTNIITNKYVPRSSDLHHNENDSLNRFELSGNFVVITNHSNLKELYSNLDWQLNHHVNHPIPVTPNLFNFNNKW